MKFSLSTGSLRRPSSSTGSSGKRVMKAPAKIPTPFGHSALAVDLDRGHPGAGGAALEDETAQLLDGERLQTFFCPGEHPVRVVDAAPDREKTGILRIPDQAHRLPGDGKAVFHLRADGDPVEPAAEGVGDIAVVLMPAVIADVLPEQARADADSYLLHRLFLLADFQSVGRGSDSRTIRQAKSHKSNFFDKAYQLVF
jgi:hypothetical protein